MKPTKQTVYLPVEYNDIIDGKIKISEIQYMTKDLILIKEDLFVFTPEQLNEYTENVIKQALEIAAKKVEMTGIAYGNDNSITDYEVDKKSITDTFEETYQLFSVD